MDIIEYLSELGIQARIGDSHAKCKCGKDALWIPNEHFAMCMACQWRPSSMMDPSASWIGEYFAEVFESCKLTLLDTEDERHRKLWSNFETRGISRGVVKNNDIGMMSAYDLTDAYEAALQRIAYEAETASKRQALTTNRKKKSGVPEYDREAERTKLTELHEALEKYQDSFEGAIVFFSTNAHGKFVRMRFRRPGESHDYAFGSTKSICGSGVFGAYRTYPLKEYKEDFPLALLPLQKKLLVCEGEFNFLQLQQKIYDLAFKKFQCVPPETQHWIWACALGASSDPDVKTVAQLVERENSGEAIICYDWDTAGLEVCNKMRAETACSSFCVPGVPEERNDKLYKTIDLCDWLKPIEDPEEAIAGFAALATRSKRVPKSAEIIADEIREIRKDKESDDQDRRVNIKDYLWDLLHQEGKVFTDGNYAYAYNATTHESWRLDDGPKSQYIFTERFGLPSGEFQRSVLRDLGLKIVHECERIQVHPWAYYDRNSFTAYFNLTHGRVARITPDKYSLVSNGRDGVYFFDPTGIESIPLEITKNVPDLDLRCSFDLGDTDLTNSFRGAFKIGRIAQRSYEMLFLAKYLSLFLPQLFSRRNIIYTSGPPGGGKTFLNSKPGWLLRGALFRPAVLVESKRDQLETMLTNESFVLIDNFDASSKPNQSLLCQACTTGSVSMRALYETNKLVKYPLISEVYMTGLQIPASFRGDLLHRVIEFPFSRYEQDGKTETERYEEFLAQRTVLLSETMARLQLALKAERAEAEAGNSYRTNFRIKDFGLFLLRQAHYGGFEDEMEQVLDNLVGTQEDRVAEKSTVFTMMTLLVGRYYEQHGRERMNATRLCTLLADMAVRLRSQFYYAGNPIGLGMYLAENQDVLRCRFGLAVSEYKGHTVYQFTPSAEQLRQLQSEAELFGSEVEMGMRADEPQVEFA